MSPALVWKLVWLNNMLAWSLKILEDSGVTHPYCILLFELRRWLEDARIWTHHVFQYMNVYIIYIYSDLHVSTVPSRSHIRKPSGNFRFQSFPENAAVPVQVPSARFDLVFPPWRHRNQTEASPGPRHGGRRRAAESAGGDFGLGAELGDSGRGRTLRMEQRAFRHFY